ncbi:aldo/keto reductase [Leptolyngbya sp. FACHB-261]|nr:aldo/keto reductase [Leptolyngbya sp. FACHB-261]
MVRRRFGRTNLQMPVFSCGGMRYQHKWQDIQPREVPADGQANLEATIHRALELGINHIETARGYGSSEMQLGWVLPKLPRESLIVQTKVSPVANAQEFRRTFEQSLAYLKLDYVDLLGLHGINTPQLLEWTVRKGGCLDVVRSLQREGKVRFVGFSTHGPTDVIVQAINTGEFDYVNLHWYYINQLNWPAIEAATRQDVGVFIISPTNKGGLLDRPPQKLVDLCSPLSPIVFNNLFCLSHPQVHTLSLGAARPQDFDEHLKTLEVLDRTQELLPPIIGSLEQALVDRLGANWVETWQQGLPKPEETPHGINIPMILWLRNLALAYDLVEYGRMRYNLLGSGGHWFPGQSAARLNRRELQKCLLASPHRDIIPDLLAEAHEILGGEAVKRLSRS